MRALKIYNNSTIKLPPELLKKLNLQEGSFLAIEEKSYGFVLCKLEVYNQFLGEFEADMQKFDSEIRNASSTLRMLLKNLVKKTEEPKDFTTKV